MQLPLDKGGPTRGFIRVGRAPELPYCFLKVRM
jgi:hypothetical protein